MGFQNSMVARNLAMRKINIINTFVCLIYENLPYFKAAALNGSLKLSKDDEAVKDLFAICSCFPRSIGTSLFKSYAIKMNSFLPSSNNYPLFLHRAGGGYGVTITGVGVVVASPMIVMISGGVIAVKKIES
jgi:hypothetical protein